MGKTKPKETRTFASIASAAASLGVSDSILKQAKRMGCAAFHPSGRVDGGTLIKFIAEHEKELTTGGVALRDQKLSEEVRKLRLKNDKDEGKLILVEAVKSCISRVLSRVDQIIEQKLSNEYPSAVAGLDVAQARIYGKRLGDQLRLEFQELREEWKIQIVNSKALLPMPAGTALSKYDPRIFARAGIKKETRDPRDYLTKQIEDVLGAADLNKTMDQDDLIEDEQLFTAWGKEDVEGLIGRLQAALVKTANEEEERK